jgi:hypothetical protein
MAINQIDETNQINKINQINQISLAISRVPCKNKNNLHFMPSVESVFQATSLREDRDWR